MWHFAGRSWTVPSLRIRFEAYFLAALMLLLLPLDWLLGALLAASFHEICHFFTACILGIKCLSIEINAGGAVMEFGPMDDWEELITAAAGPVGSFVLCGLGCVYPQMAVCGLAQGLFNLLPIWPLDGGRIIRCMFQSNPRLCGVIEFTAAVIILCVGVWLSTKLGIGPGIFAGIVTLKAFLRKIPCKDAFLGVQ